MKNFPLRLMGLGISLMLLGMYIKLEEGLNQYTYDSEFYIVLLGLLICVIGFFKKDSEE